MFYVVFTSGDAMPVMCRCVMLNIMFAAKGQLIALRRCVMHYVMITEGGRETEISTERARRDETASAAGEREQRARTQRET